MDYDFQQTAGHSQWIRHSLDALTYGVQRQVPLVEVAAEIVQRLFGDASRTALQYPGTGHRRLEVRRLTHFRWNLCRRLFERIVTLRILI